MINEIYVNDKLIINELPKKQFKFGFKIKCNECGEVINRKWFDNKVLTDKYICKKCVLTRYNPMYDLDVKNKHLESVNNEEYKNKMSEMLSGKKNPFYGKTHTEESKLKIINKNKEYNNNLTDDEKEIRAKTASLREKNRKKKDPIGYSQQKREAAISSHISQFNNCKPNKIETFVEEWLKENDIKYKYSLILGFKQFDFGIKGKRVLIEVDGDNWQGNPLYFNIDGSDGKRKLNKIQLGKIKQDKEKNKWAVENDFKIIRIWEQQIYSGEYKKILNNIL